MSCDLSLSEVRPPEFSSSINFEVCIHRLLKKGGTFTVMLYNKKFDQLLRGDHVPAGIIQMVASTQVYAGPNCLAYWV
jgi:hypothetical protein